MSLADLMAGDPRARLAFASACVIVALPLFLAAAIFLIARALRRLKGL